jgi:chaperonin GroEL (HSP60 family)
MITEDLAKAKEDKTRSTIANSTFVVMAKSYAQEVVESIAMINKDYNLDVRLAVMNIPSSISEETFRNLSVLTGSIIAGGHTEYPLLKGEKSPFYGIEKYGTVEELRITTIPKPEFIFIPHEKVYTYTLVKSRISELKTKLNDKSAMDYEKDILKVLLNQIDGKVANLYIAGDGEVETSHLMLKAEDAVNACKSASETGIVAGGSVVLRDAIKTVIKSKTKESQKLSKALNSLYNHILENAGLKPHNFRKNRGYDVSSGKQGNMFDLNIIDPTKGFVHGIKNAYSLAKQINNSSTIIIKTSNE